MMEFEEARGKVRGVVDAVGRVYIGKSELVKLAVATLLVEGHLLIEGYPGTGKTHLAKALAKAIGGRFRRVQGHPDILPSDVLGFHIYRLDGSKEFIAGPVMTNILLFDELNRAPARSQAALLEPMQEYQATIDGATYPLPRPFMVIATMIPEAIAIGVYRLSEAMVDRFAARVESYYNPREEELEVVERSDELARIPIEPVVTLEEVITVSRMLPRLVEVKREVAEYILDLMEYARRHEAVSFGPSHRAAIHLLRISRVYALMDGRDYVIPDDVKAAAVSVVAHRVFVKDEYAAEGVTGRRVVEEALSRVPVPK